MISGGTNLEKALVISHDASFELMDGLKGPEDGCGGGNKQEEGTLQINNDDDNHAERGKLGFQGLMSGNEYMVSTVK